MLKWRDNSKTGVTMKRIILTIATAFLAMGLCASACAQYVWIDKDNRKHYSDQPPPASVPNNRILKSPGNRPAKNISETSPELGGSGANTPTAPAPASTQAPMSAAEKNADFNKRKMEQAEKDKKAEEDKKHVDTKAQNCERAKEYQRTLNSGERISRISKSGEREFLSDVDRSKESREVQEALKECN
jgi:hypothetical protein